MPQVAGKAGERQRNIEALYRRFGTLLEHAESARLAMGRIIAQLREDEEPWAKIVRELNSRYPEAPKALGHEFTQQKVKDMLMVHQTFAEGNGVVSPDGKWHVTAEQVDALSLTGDDLAKATTQLLEGKLPVKKVVRQANKAMRAAKRSETAKVAEARQEVLKLLGTAKPEQLTLEQKLEAAKHEKELAEKNLTRAQERAKVAAEALKALQAAVQARMDKANTKLSGSKVTPKRGRRGSKSQSRQPTA